MGALPQSGVLRLIVQEYITEPAEEDVDIRKKGHSTVVYRFNVNSFNPWTGEFVEKKWMMNVHSWEQLSGSWTGLIPDE